jgi:hypothetical protein
MVGSQERTCWMLLEDFFLEVWANEVNEARYSRHLEFTIGLPLLHLHLAIANR